MNVEQVRKEIRKLVRKAEKIFRELKEIQLEVRLYD